MNTDIANLKAAVGDSATRPSSLATLRLIASRSYDHRQKDAKRTLMELDAETQRAMTKERDDDEDSEIPAKPVCETCHGFPYFNEDKSGCPACGQ